ncbi:kinase-like protein [Dentipellis sp. KUC8613]|nr:kinase-like protein [Dentipellis sp. KUC8613]
MTYSSRIPTPWAAGTVVQASRSKLGHWLYNASPCARPPCELLHPSSYLKPSQVLYIYSYTMPISQVLLKSKTRPMAKSSGTVNDGGVKPSALKPIQPAVKKASDPKPVRMSALEAVRRQISEQKQKTDATKKAKTEARKSLSLVCVARDVENAPPIPISTAARLRQAGAHKFRGTGLPGLPGRPSAPLFAALKQKAGKTSQPQPPKSVARPKLAPIDNTRRTSGPASASPARSVSLTRNNAVRRTIPPCSRSEKLKPSTTPVTKSVSAPLLEARALATKADGVSSTSGPVRGKSLGAIQPKNALDLTRPTAAKLSTALQKSALKKQANKPLGQLVSFQSISSRDEEHDNSERTDVTPPLLLSIQDFAVDKMIGHGSFGKVALVRPLWSKKAYAVKVVSKARLAHKGLDRAAKQMLREREISQMVASIPFLLGVEASFHDNINFYMVMEYCPSSLWHYWCDNPIISLNLLKQWGAEMAFGLNALHKKGVVHRDFKMENVLIRADGHVMICDFGLCKLFEQPTILLPPVTINGQTTSKKHVRSNPTTMTTAGTWHYMAPELWQGMPYSYPIDWFAFGVMMYAIHLGSLPWDGVDHLEVADLILNTPFPFDPSQPFNEECVALIHLALEKNPEDRITFGGLQAMPFFSTINWEQLAVSGYDASLPGPKTDIPTATSGASLISMFKVEEDNTMTKDPHPEYAWMSDAFANDKKAADLGLFDDIIVDNAITSLDGAKETPIFVVPDCWRKAFLPPSECQPHQPPTISNADRFSVKKWWRRVTGAKSHRA